MEIKGRLKFISFIAIVLKTVMFCGHLVGPCHGQNQILGPNFLPAALSPTGDRAQSSREASRA